MMKFAEIANGNVINIVLAEEKLHPHWIECPQEIRIGDKYENGIFVIAERVFASDQYQEEEAESLNWPRFVGNAKLDLFTRAEQLAVVAATMTDPIVKLIYDRMIGAAYMSYEDPETGQGLALLEVKGLLTAERKAEIVAQMQPR